MNIKDTLLALTSVDGVSGAEEKATEVASRYLTQYCDTVKVKNGNVIGKLGDFSKGKHILLDAHIDQIGFIVTYITDDGFLKISNIGGIDRRLLLAQEVIVYGKEVLKGVIVSTPPHLETDGAKIPEITDICIDIGMSKQSAERVVSLGDRVAFGTQFSELLGDRVTAKSLDDRAGVATILYALECLKNDAINCEITVLFSTQEEVGERGAKISAFDIDADTSIVVDVSFGYTEGSVEYKCGKLGKGPMIGYSPALDHKMSRELTAIAKECEIPYQLEIMGSDDTGTNADVISSTRCGVVTGMISIPLKYMHTPVEVISLSDIENSGKLIAEYVRRYM